MVDLSISQSYANTLEEWKEARAVLARFDGNLADLRKYGFTFLAALLAADSVQALFKLEENMRFALVLITIAFIVTLRLLDHSYQQFQNATSTRARILETILNIELTEAIANRYKKDRLRWYIFFLYISFAIMADGLGFGILSPDYWSWLIVAAVVGIGLIFLFSMTLTVNLQHQKDLPREDWTVNRTSCEQHEKVRITVTNLDEKKNIHFGLGSVVCEIKDEEGNLVHTIEAESEMSVPKKHGNHSWLWDTEKAKPDEIYRIWPRGWDAPMRRSILVCKQKSTHQTEGDV